jgi:hypothetical protein
MLYYQLLYNYQLRVSDITWPSSGCTKLTSLIVLHNQRNTVTLVSLVQTDDGHVSAETCS